MSLQDTPRANRLHIGLFGRRNSGKSSLVNALTNQQISLVSDVAGTTTDPVYKSMEIYGIGPCVFIDTAGYDDVGALGAMRVEKTRHAGEKTDIALIVCSGAELEEEIRWLEDFKASKTPVVLVLNKTDEHGSQTEQLADFIEKSTGLRPVPVSAKERTGIEQLRAAILAALPEDYEERTITGGLVEAGDTVLLVMPQDIQAPKGRLILPQVQTIRDLLDKKCIVISSTADKFEAALQAMKEPPALIITDSQVFPLVYDKKPAASRLTSFSVLFARYKGDVDFFTDSVKKMEVLSENSHVLIAEACTHAPLGEDIGRVQIPRLLRQRFGPGIKITTVSGPDFPADVSAYDLVIHCGACMFNRKYVLARAQKAKGQKIPMTNYGIFLAYMAGILDKIDVK